MVIASKKASRPAPKRTTTRPPASGVNERATAARSFNKPSPDEVAKALDDTPSDLRIVEHPIGRLHELVYDLGAAWLLAIDLDGPVATQLAYLLHHTRSRLQNIHHTLSSEAPAKAPAPSGVEGLLEATNELHDLVEDFETATMAITGCAQDESFAISAAASTMQRLTSRLAATHRKTEAALKAAREAK